MKSLVILAFCAITGYGLVFVLKEGWKIDEIKERVTEKRNPRLLLRRLERKATNRGAMFAITLFADLSLLYFFRSVLF